MIFFYKLFIKKDENYIEGEVIKEDKTGGNDEV